MKKIWLFLSVIGSIFTLLLGTFLFSLKEEYELIYFNHTPSTMLTIRGVDSEESNKEVLQKLQQYAQDNGINIYRQITNINELTQYNQDIYVNISDEDLFKKTFHIKKDNIDLSKVTVDDMDQFTNSVIKIHPFIESEKEGIEGFYQFQSNNLNERNLYSFLNSINIQYEKTKKLSLSDILEYIENQPAVKPLVYSLFFFLITFVFVSLYEIFNRFKEIAILKMMGNKKRDIIFRLTKEKILLLGKVFTLCLIGSLAYNLFIKKGARLIDFILFLGSSLVIYMGVVLCIYIVLLLFIGIVDITNMVKGKKNIKLIKPFHAVAIVIFTIVLAFFLTNVRNEHKKLNDSIDNLDVYKSLQGYVTTNVTINNDEESEFEYIGKKLKKLTLENYDNIVLYNPSAFYLPGYEEYLKDVQEEEPFILINENYLDNLSNIGIKKDQISKNSNTITLLLPKSLEGRKEDLKILSESLAINKDNDDSASSIFDTEIIMYENKDVPIYADSFKKYRYAKYNAPIFIVVTKENMSSFGKAFNSNLAAWYSSGSILLSEKNGDKISQLLIKENLDRNIRNTVDIYSKLTKEVSEIKNEVIIYISSFIVLLVVYYNLIVFSTLSYLEEKKQEIFCKKIMGYSYIKLHKEYLTTISIEILTGIILSYLIANADLLSAIIIILLAIVLVNISLTIPTILEKKGK